MREEEENEEEKKLAAALVAHLGMDFDFAVCREPLPPQALTAGEQIQLAAFTHTGRRAEWLRGRNAIKALRIRFGEDPDTSRLHFPHPHLSLTHANGLAIAVGTRDPKKHGLGIDYEALRTMRPESTRFFLDGAEHRALSMPVSESDLLRLWVVKEAVFKADVDNSGRLLRHYRLRDPNTTAGTANCRKNPAKVFRYAVLKWGDGFVGLAVAE